MKNLLMAMLMVLMLVTYVPITGMGLVEAFYR